MSAKTKRQTKRSAPKAPRAIYVYGDDGEIIQSIGPATSEMIAVYEQNGFQFIVSDEIRNDMHSKFYIEDGQLLRKKAFTITASKQEIASDGKDEAIVSGVPVGVNIAVIVAGQISHYTADEESISITSVMAAVYRLRFTAPRMVPFEIEIVAK